MKIAKNSKGKMINILDSSKEDVFYCPICGEELKRKFGVEKQYYAHPIGKGDECELKMKLILKKDIEICENDLNILRREYYDKQFENTEVILSDYKSEEGYYLTQQQKDIMFSKEKKIKVSALAGSAKSSTLYYYAKERPNNKILYIVYNRAMKEEADKMFRNLNNVTIKTMHGLAYGYYGFKYKNKLTFSYNAVDVMNDLGLDWEDENDQEIAVKTYKLLQEYLLSDKTEINEIDMWKRDKERDIIFYNAEILWNKKKDLNSDVKVEHDFYLKLFQLSKHKLNYKFDSILIDESQDASMLILDVIKSSCIDNVVLIGDKYQKIYGWRKAENIMELYKEAVEYKLTTSFRVSQSIANISNLLIEDVDDIFVDMKGFNSKQKIVESINKKEKYACLCRTNAGIFSNVLDALKHGKTKLYFEGGYSSYRFQNILDGYKFHKGKEVKNPMFNKFKNWYQMLEFIDKNDDLELKAIVKMIDEYGDEIPELISSIKNNTIKNKEESDVIFSTIHRSKGQTYTCGVLISDDHFDINKYFMDKFITMSLNQDIEEKEKTFEEMAIIYVAMTRCARDIELSNTLKQYLITRYKFNKQNND